MAESPATASPSPKPAARVGRLDTLARVRREAVRLYASARSGEMPASDASRLASVLQLVASLVTASTIEERLASLEARAPW